MDEAIIEWEEEEEGEDDGTGESPKHPPRLFIPNVVVFFSKEGTSWRCQTYR
jgi:hypothetical protein